MTKFGRVKALALGASASGLLFSPLHAETLQEAFVKAYRNNPTLTGARANQRALDEQVNIVRADGRPAADASANYTEQLHQEASSAFSGTGPRRSLTGQAQLSVPIYSGGIVRNSLNAAKLRVQAGQNDLRATEASIFSAVVGAYLDVIRDSEIVNLRAQNVEALDFNLRGSRDRFEVGDLTRTDVAQSESRLAIAQSDLQAAQAQLIASKENYTALVGTPPTTLETPPPLPGLPTSAETASAVALSDNADIRAAGKGRDAARYDVKAAKGQVMPRLSAFATANYNNYLNSVENDGLAALYNAQTSAAAGATITLPLYQGGRPGASARQAAARESAAIELTVEVERSVIAQVRGAYASWQASLRSIEATQKAVDATQLSLEGVKAENSVGARTILDILNAQQEALNARVQLVSAKRNAYVAAFSLLAAMGHAEARDMGLDPATLYDPQAAYQRTSGKLIDFDFPRQPQGIAQSTRDSKPADTQPIVVPGY
ncbi:MAG: TolC family outer membrane protein [Sphingobium sp.]